MPPTQPPPRTLVAEATRRSGVVWLGRRGEPPVLVWHVWHAGSAWVVGGGREQDLPVGPGDDAVVVVRSKAAQSGVVVAWDAEVSAVVPGSPEWEQVVPLLAVERLNAATGDAERWPVECVVLRLAPAG